MVGAIMSQEKNTYEDGKKEGEDEEKIQKKLLKPLSSKLKEVQKEGISMPLSYFQPTLVDMLVPIKIKNYKDYPYFGDMPRYIYEDIVGSLPIELPLELVFDLIIEESYWKRRSLARWHNCDIAYHGDSWKQLYFECNLNDYLESYDLTKDWEEDLRFVMKISAPYVHNIDICKFPSHMQLLAINDEFKSNLCTLKIEYGNPNVGMAYDIRDFGILNSDCLSLSAFCSVTYTLTDLNLSSNLMTDDHVATLVVGMAQNPTIVNLDLSHNLISDAGCEHLARLLDSKNCVILFLNLCNNRIKTIGIRAIGYSLSTNKSLISLNLCLNDLGDYGGHCIFDYMLDNQVIQRLSISATGFTVEGIEALSRLLHLPQSELIYLDISANPGIGPTAGQIIYTALLTKKKMKELNVKKCGFGIELEAKFEGLLMARKFDEEDLFLNLEVREEKEDRKKNKTSVNEKLAEGDKDVKNTKDAKDS